MSMMVGAGVGFLGLLMALLPIVLVIWIVLLLSGIRQDVGRIADAMERMARNGSNH